MQIISLDESTFIDFAVILRESVTREEDQDSFEEMYLRAGREESMGKLGRDRKGKENLEYKQ